MREIGYLREKTDPNWLAVAELGWSEESLEIACSLNAFYQIVVGPLASSTRHSVKTGLGSKTPIAYGELITFDQARSRAIEKMHAEFEKLVAKARIEQRVLYANHADDMLAEIIKGSR